MEIVLHGIFEDCFVPDESLLGERGRGFVNAMSQVLDGGRISIAALAVGIAQGAFESALSLKERQQFGKPISQFQAIQFKLADMATQIDAARLLTLRAAALKDRRSTNDVRVGNGQTVRFGDCCEGLRRGDPGAWRLWIYKGLPG